MTKRLVLPENRRSATAQVERTLRRSLVGQDRPITEISRALSQAEAGFQDPNHPLAVLAFFGPTGVGKTYCAELLADIFAQYVWRCPRPKECGGFEISTQEWERLSGKGATQPVCPHHRKKKSQAVGLVKISLPKIWTINCGQLSDMAGFNNNTFLGAPPGYLGYDKSPLFSGKAPKVVLFDEIEKVILPKYWWRENNGFGDFLLKILDTGKITNNQGEEVDFTQSLIILTGNLGAREIKSEFEKSPIGFLSAGPSLKISDMSDKEIEELNKRIYRIVSKKAEKEFAPEFMNRIDRLVVFHFLTKANYRLILERELDKIQRRIIKSPTPFKIELANSARKMLVDEAFSDRKYGARPLNRVLRKRLVTPLSDLANHRLITKGAVVRVQIEKGKFSFYQKEEKKMQAVAQDGVK